LLRETAHQIGGEFNSGESDLLVRGRGASDLIPFASFEFGSKALMISLWLSLETQNDIVVLEGKLLTWEMSNGLPELKLCSPVATPKTWEIRQVRGNFGKNHEGFQTSHVA
jgi:hypothetical protein